MPKRNKIGFTFLEAFIASTIIIVLWAMSQPNIHRSSLRFSKVQNECLSNQRVLQGAIELYNLDQPTLIMNVYPGLDYERCEKTLLDTKYLKNPILPTYEGCSYGYIEIDYHDTIFCKIHGSLESSTSQKELSVPEYDKSLEIPFSPDYKDYRNKIIDEKTREKRLNDLKKELGQYFPKFLIILYFSFALISHIAGKKQKKA